VILRELEDMSYKEIARGRRDPDRHGDVAAGARAQALQRAMAPPTHQEAYHDV